MRHVATPSTWYAKGRWLQMICWSVYTASALLNVVLSVSDDRSPWWLGFQSAMLMVGIVLMWVYATRRVAADQVGLRLHHFPARTRMIPWNEISEFRADAPGVRGRHLVVVQKDDEVVNLPLKASELGPVERWKVETGSQSRL